MLIDAGFDQSERRCQFPYVGTLKSLFENISSAAVRIHSFISFAIAASASGQVTLRSLIIVNERSLVNLYILNFTFLYFHLCPVKQREHHCFVLAHNHILHQAAPERVVELRNRLGRFFQPRDELLELPSADTALPDVDCHLLEKFGKKNPDLKM